MKKRLSLFLSLLTLVSAMTACASAPDDSPAETTAAAVTEEDIAHMRIYVPKTAK